jgi:DNA-binding transcriptional LysR family regulator
MDGVELRHLAVFAAVAEEGSFTAAARRLKMAQSGVSAAVRALEHEFRVTLFDRTTHRVELTLVPDSCCSPRRGARWQPPRTPAM